MVQNVVLNVNISKGVVPWLEIPVWRRQLYKVNEVSLPLPATCALMHH